MSELSVALLRASALIHHLHDHGLLRDRTWTISEHPHSPWLTIDAVAYDSDHGRTYRFAIWKKTGALYVVGPDGAVGDDPVMIGDVDLDA